MEEALEWVLANWATMQTSDPDDAGEDAERFEQSFYRFIDTVADFMTQLPVRPHDLDAALENPLLANIRDRLPGPLQLNFDTELEDLCQLRSLTEDDA
ncbi:MAG: hypothetical protein OWT28_09195 [Firmicutes bacterium]|nr:hypothetical protein [Bacillota bacterium]